MVYCSSCGTANRDGSSFCNDCGAKLPSGTSLRCPQCGTPNSLTDTFCKKCSARLVPTLADDTPEPEPPAVPLKKGLSLPTKPAADASPTPADWLGQLRSSLDSAADAESAGPDSPEDTLVPQPSVAPQPTAEPAGEVPDWLTSLGIISNDNPPLASKADEAVPEWLSQLPINAADSVTDSSLPASSTEPTDPADWLSSLRAVAPAESASDSDEEIPEWLRTLGTGPLPSAQPDQSATPAGSPPGLVRPASTTADEDEIPEWMRALGTGPLPSAQPDRSAASTASTTGDEEEIPEWMRTLGTGPLPSAAVEPAPSTMATPAEPEDAGDWLTSLRAAAPTPEPEPITAVTPAESLPADQPPAPEELPDWLRNLGTVDHTQRSTDELPDWLDSLGTEAPTPEVAAAETDTPAEDDVSAWLRNLGASAVMPADETPETALTIGEPSDWMSALRATASQPAESVESISEPAADETPDWLQAMGLPTSEEPAPTPAADEADWMSSLRATAAQPVEPASEPAADETPDWLQAVGLPTSEEPAPTPAADEADWMSSFRATALQPAEPASEPAADETPDWLQAMGLPASGEPAPIPTADEADWMSSFRVTASQPAEPASEPAADETPDWLQAIGLPASEEPAPAPAADETLDWMSSFRATASQSTESVESISEPAADEAPDWLQAVGLPTSDEPAPTPAADETLDWMSSFRATASQPVESTGEPAADETPDWLQAVGLPTSEEPAPTPATDETLDWMSSLRATTSQPTESAEPISEPVADEVPDWLQAVGLPTSEEPAPTPATDETLDWMSSLRATAAQPTESAEPISEPAADEVPDWLQAMGLPASEPAPTPAADETPDWLRDAGVSATVQPTESAEPISESAADEVPDWLRSFEEPAARSVMAESPISASTADDIPDWLRDAGASVTDQPAKTEASDLPDWLQDTSAATEPEPASSIEPAADLPDWLGNLQTPAAQTAGPIQPEREAPAGRVEEPAPDQTAVPAELPDWLKSLRQGKAAVPVQPAEPLPGLIQAEIPSWLEALRPKEGQAAAVADVSAESEQEGVFAGLSNILPAMPGLDELPAQISHEVTGPSADDLARAGIFQELLTRPVSRPTAVAALTTSGRPAQRRALQWIIAILLMVTVALPFVMPQGWLPLLPHADNLPLSPLVQSAVTRITVLPPNANVLVVFDYDPAQAGEMNQIAEMLLRHLQTRAANITAVSLNPLGAGLAGSVWAVIGAPTGGQRNDLGYVPGQAIGVQNVLLNNGPFDLVIDLSASADSLRWWVEQLTVSGFNMPFIAGVSAAVESLALPYAQSGQITGLISGATGALMYARQADLLTSLDEAQLERNQYHIESQTLAHWLLAILIVIGLVSGLVSRVGRRSAS